MPMVNSMSLSQKLGYINAVESQNTLSTFIINYDSTGRVFKVHKFKTDIKDFAKLSDMGLHNPWQIITTEKEKFAITKNLDSLKLNDETSFTAYLKSGSQSKGIYEIKPSLGSLVADKDILEVIFKFGLGTNQNIEDFSIKIHLLEGDQYSKYIKTSYWSRIR